MSSLIHIVSQLDLRIYSFVARFAGDPILCRLAKLEEKDNLLKGGVFFSIFWYQWFRDDHKQEERRRKIVAILLASVLAIIAVRAVSFSMPFRDRPMNDVSIAHPAYALQIDYNMEQWSSFPSDSAGYFVSLAVGIAYLSRFLSLPVLIYTAVWICMTRIFLGIHFASDMVVGALIGILITWGCVRSRFVESRIAAPIVDAMETHRKWAFAFAFAISFEMANVFDGARSFGNALIHAVLSLLRVRQFGNGSRPIDTWGGVVVTAVLVALVAFVSTLIARKVRNARRHAPTASTEDVGISPRDSQRVPRVVN